jgi:hypothetical protein
MSSVAEFVMFCCICAFIIVIIMLPSPNIEDFQKQAISYGYATYDLDGNFIWIEPKK